MNEIPLVPITTDIPAPIRQELKVALAVHGVKLKDAMAEAIALWLAAKGSETNRKG